MKRIVFIALIVFAGIANAQRLHKIERGNLSGTALTSIYLTTLNGGEAQSRFVPMYAQVITDTVSGLVSVATISLGTNATDYNNVVAASAMTGLTSANLFMPITIASGASSIAHGTDLYVKVTVAAVGTTYKFRVILWGYYLR